MVIWANCIFTCLKIVNPIVYYVFLGFFVCMFERRVVSFVFVLSGGSISVYLKIWDFYPQ